MGRPSDPEGKHHRMLARKAQARAEEQLVVQKRQADRAARGDAGQLAKLDALFGVGQGAKRERARLAGGK